MPDGPSILSPARLLSRLRLRPRAPDDLLTGPIRGELLGAEHLADRARAIGRAQRVVLTGRRNAEAPLLARLKETRRVLATAYDRLTEGASSEADVGPAGDWLLDNYYVVLEHMREVQESLPRRYYRELPELARGELAGYPRVYELAIALISHTEGRIDRDNVERFLSAFQSEIPLSIGELWAIPAMLRLGLIESVRRMALRSLRRLDENVLADLWAERIEAASTGPEGALSATIEDFVRRAPDLTPAFLARFLQKVHLTTTSAPQLERLERWIGEEAMTAEDAASRATQHLALTQVVMANSITSLRIIAGIDWTKVVEGQSAMEAVLREDPAGAYARMTFSTRDRYRHVVERVSKRTGIPEVDVARHAIDLAREGVARRGAKSVDAHVGYYLIDDGRKVLDYETGYRRSPAEALHAWALRHPNLIFGGGILVCAAAALAAVFWLAGPAARSAWPLVLLLALIPAFDIAISVVNQLVTALLPPRTLPKLDLEEGIPEEFKTAVVIPTLFGSVAAVEEALENLEVQFLANREAHLHFALLSDFTDASTEHVAGDEEIVAAATAGIRALNAQYASAHQDAFYLFHRPRRWNEQQGVWMGWERKRGKLGEFNRFVAGNESGFSETAGSIAALRGVRYVVTLDSDTVLPPGSAPLLVGAAAHPLNRPAYDPELGRVVRGYAILQPRVGVSLPSAHRSRFAAIFSGHPGVDPYTTAVSDVYQDLYGEGSFTGKGIYDVQAFEQATHGRFPENTLLSHDLIEGSYARAGLTTDIIVYDDYPTQYLTYTRRKHRWIRGDWQLLPWLMPRVPGPGGSEPNRLSMLSRLKILDNLRRSTVEVAQLLFLLAAWTILPGSPARWTLLGVLAIGAPWIVSQLLVVLRPPLDRSWRAYYAAAAQDAVTSLRQILLAITFLPHQAWISVDAVGRTLWRLFVSRRHLLEWQTSSAAERSATGSRVQAWRAMWIAPVVALAALGLALAVSPPPTRAGWLELAASMLPIVALWLGSPAIARALSGPVPASRTGLSDAGATAALRYALLHWRFFDRFVTAKTHWLAPDNYQEKPTPIVAMRTSPTNIGLHLLSTVSAYDLGFITVEGMTRRLELSFRTLERLRRSHGHFFNWYDLEDLHVLEPAYISTVDSGNLAGHFIALRQACISIADAPLSPTRWWPALDAALGVTAESLHNLGRAEIDAPPARWEAVAYATGLVRESRGDFAAARSEDELAQAFRAVDQALGEAEAALTGLAHGHRTATAQDWIDWTRHLVGAHSTQLDSLNVGASGSENASPPSLRELAELSTAAANVLARLLALAERAYDYAMEMDFGVLYDTRRKLFAIGLQHGTNSLDPASYDLLASEARLASFVAVAKNDVPTDHWFRLGRSLTREGGDTALVSWSGSMFEYLMPLLVMRSFPSTMLDHTYTGAVRRQIAYGLERSVPWGVSESAYNLRDRHLTYQYRAFGVPDLALKRGLGRDLVIAPYASMLALLVDPPSALSNLVALERQGALGPYGFRDALDYTRPDPGQRCSVVANYMAHHIGMSLVALTNAIADNVWQSRFHADPMVRSAEVLLHERVPRRLVFQSAQATRADEALPNPELEQPAVREIDTPDTPQPHIALLGRLPYTLMVSHCGAGYSRYEDLAVTRWRADGTSDSTGQFCYVKDVSTNRVWSAAHQPICAPADYFRTLLATDRVTFHRTDGDIETRTEIAVVPEDAAEVRCVTVVNHGADTRDIELTSYGEIVLAPPDADRQHPAFGNLFVETEWHEWCTAITATRRPRSAKEPAVWCVHVVDTGDSRVGPVTCETDRARFLGRGRSTRDPAAMQAGAELSGSTGAVLDPIFALRATVRLEPGASASVAFTTLVATTRVRAFELADRYHDRHAAQRALDLAWTSQQVELRELALPPADATVYQEIAGYLLFPDAGLRAPQDELRRNRGGQPLLWANGVSGDWPIVLATIGSLDGIPTLRQVFSAHRYWRRRGMKVDLVVINSHPSGYLQELNGEIMEAMYASSDSGLDEPGGVFVRRQELLSPDELLMLRATARVHIPCDGRPLGRIVATAVTPPPAELDGLSPPREIERRMAEVTSGRRARVLGPPEAGVALEPISGSRPARRLGETDGGPLPQVGTEALRFANPYGGVTAAGDYRIRVRGDFLPPAPWSNVVANPDAGFVVTERGGGFTWASNSFFFRLTPWRNDPVGDAPGEIAYLRDDETGEIWSATPAPISGDAAYVVEHGAGSSTFAHAHRGIGTDLLLGIAPEAPVKLSVLRITNHDVRARRITLTAYAEWTLGVNREQTQHHVATEYDGTLGAILATNAFEPQFSDQVAFCAISEPVLAHTADRCEFIGRNGSADDPLALRAGHALSGTTGAGHDPCAALQCAMVLEPGESREIVVLLGATQGHDAARELIARYRTPIAAREGIDATRAAWAARLTTITVRTPEPAFDAMVNRWTLYQALACRMWARSALYQSSGAFGFRDQLQDTMAFVYAEPAIAREHILRAAARQFLEGDVQHWWHPQSGRGVRTRFSDDLAWLPFVVDHYIAVTGDRSVLDEYVPFLSMRPLGPDEHEVYDLPQVTDEHGSVYEHCLRALGKACTVGEHGLPLIGIGDWNDGMNRVGVEGRGESVWLAWFLVRTLRSFAEHVELRGDSERAGDFRRWATAYAAAVEAHAWDGEWYRRAYFDDGSPLGSAQSEEARIDSIAQSWSVISGAGDPGRQATAMRSLNELLVREDARLLVLLTPPFDRTTHDPGYIKGYLPGVRENGAQYTHAALWAVLATAMRGEGDRAFELFQMINPLTRATNAADTDRYKVEPYVVAADVYTAPGQLGRGGWTWYTGSASWMYRVGLESILGFTKRGDTLTLNPCVPTDWPSFSIDYRFGRATYEIEVEQPAALRHGATVTLDGVVLPDGVIPLRDDGARHVVSLRPRTR